MPERRRDTLPKSHRRTVGASTTGPNVQVRRVSRRDREDRQRRRLFWILGIAGAVAALILAYSSLNEYVIKPSHVLATVDGTTIRRRDYWRVRSVNLTNEVNQYSSFAQSPMLGAQQKQQYSTLASQAAAALKTVWGSTKVDDPTLNQMIEDQIYVKRAGSLGVKVTTQQIDDYITQAFQPSDAPLITPTPSPTLIPTRAAWATETALAALATTTRTSSPIASPVADGSVGAIPASESLARATPVATDANLVAASPASSGATPITTDASVAGASPESSVATPVASASPSATTAATPNPVEAQETVTARYKDFKATTLKRAHMSESEFRDWIAAPAVARQGVRAAIEAQIGQSREQIHAIHILVDTKDLADSIHTEVTQPGADFAAIAKAQSKDATTAPNGGDLGWFPRGEMVKPFEDAVFALQPDQISQPFQTQFGWHIVKVLERDPARPMTTAQISKVQKQAVDRWLADRRAESKISTKLKPTPTPAVAQFAPPADAPPTPTPAPSSEASPIVADGGATPVGSGP